jgi:hypothetical protein
LPYSNSRTTNSLVGVFSPASCVNISLTTKAQAEESARESTMNPLRKPLHNGLPVAYADDVTEDQVRKINELVQNEFNDDGWVTVEQES